MYYPYTVSYTISVIYYPSYIHLGCKKNMPDMTGSVLNHMDALGIGAGSGAEPTRSPRKRPPPGEGPPLRPSQTIGKSGFFTIREDRKTMEDGDLTKELGFISGFVLDNACFLMDASKVRCSGLCGCPTLRESNDLREEVHKDPCILSQKRHQNHRLPRGNHAKKIWLWES
jgi:hypothetical protein